MYKYFAINDNITEIVIKLQDDLIDFIDYSCCITEPVSKYKVYGWVKFGKKVNSNILQKYNLIM